MAKYRIIKESNEYTCVYVIQRRGWLWWQDLWANKWSLGYAYRYEYQSLSDAEYAVKQLIKDETPTKREVL